MKAPKDKGVTDFPRQQDRVSVMWGGCGLFQELQATGETPERWGMFPEDKLLLFRSEHSKGQGRKEKVPLREHHTVNK